MDKIYKRAPLPFIGQKRYFLRDFADVLERANGKFDTVVDLFGGSGLLSYTAKRILPDCRVIYNDFDHYDRRLAAIEDTNAILAAIKELLNGVEPNKRLTERQHADVLAIVEDAQNRLGWVDIVTISRTILFSGKWVTTLEELRKQVMYKHRCSDKYGCAGYLDGLEVVHMDYRELFEQHRENSRTLFVFDPPYLSTECGMYGNYWKLTDYLNVLRMLEGTKYIYFTSDKSQIVELCEWLFSAFGVVTPLYGASKHVRTNTINYHAKFNDIMITNI